MTAAWQITVGRAAGVVSAIAFVPYLVAVVRRRTRPSIASWFIWTAVGAVLCASYWATGARASIWVAVSYVAGPLVTAIVALRYGERGWSRFDKGCLLTAALSLGLWALTGDPFVALGLNILVDFLGALPTMRNVWRDPDAEDRAAWGIFFAGNAINLGAVEAWTPSGAAYPVYLVLVTLIVNALIWRPRAMERG
jgi:uncharacterized protein with PQ loop repeat